MLSYQTPATIKANNAEADRIMKEQGHGGVVGATGSRSESLAKAHAEALARRKAG